MDKRGLIQFYQNLVAPQMGGETARKAIREAAIRPLSLSFFLGYQLYSCAVTRLSQEVISINCKFLDKIFLQLHPVSEISEKDNGRI